MNETEISLAVTEGMWGKLDTMVALKYGSNSPKVTHHNVIIKGQAELSNFPRINRKNCQLQATTQKSI